MKKIKLHNVCKLRTPSCSHCEHFHVYLAYRRQTGTVVTRQTYDPAPRLTRPPTAHISRGGVSTACIYIYTGIEMMYLPVRVLSVGGGRR